MKLLRLFVLFFSGLLMIRSAGAQSCTIRFSDQETDEPLEGVIITIAGQKTSAAYITDKNGFIHIQKVLQPFDLHARHVSYEEVMATIHTKDTSFLMLPATTTMDEIVITTDPYRDVAMPSDLFDVRVVSRKTIDQLAGNNLSDVLNYNINMAIIPDVATGRSTVNMFGLSGEYVKILVDNVPVAGDNGSGNNIDISQINLENVERIEISEGSMGVMYGSNAVAGVINIITKKQLDKTWEAQASVQEETVGSEYTWFGRGRHIQNLSISSNPHKKWFASAKISNNIFKGFYNGYEGKNYAGSDNHRGHEWNPKNQTSINGLVNHQITPRISAFYKFEQFRETLDIYNHTVNTRLGIDGEPDHTASDEQYNTTRQGHQINLNGELGKLPFWIIGSYQNQERQYERYTYNIDYRTKTSSQGKVTNQSSKVWYSKGNLDNIIPDLSWWSLNIGYELEHQKGFDAIASGEFSNNISQQTLSYYDLYLTSSFSPFNKLSLTPGLRTNNNSKYGSHFIWSSTLKYNWPHEISSQIVAGSAYKTPNFSQLYYYFVDANHNVTGNQNLNPESGISLMLDVDKTSQLGSFKIKTRLKGYHYQINDKITMVQVLNSGGEGGTSSQRFTYLNADNYLNYGSTLENSIEFHKLTWTVGANYISTRQYLDSDKQTNAHSNTLSALSRLSYSIPKADLSIGLNAKFSGRGRQFYQSGDTVEPGKLQRYTLMDASIQKGFLSKSLNITLGARNLLNVVSVGASGLSGGGGHDAVAPSTQFFSTGRSYFLKITYKISS